MSPAGRKKPSSKKAAPAKGGASTALLDEIRGRRDATVEQALGLLDLAAVSDDAAKESLLSTASRRLHDPKVAGRWIELAAAEKEPGLRGRMIRRATALDPRGIPALDPWVRLLVEGLQDDATRDAAIAGLASLLAAHPDAAKLLAETYAGERHAERQRALLSALCRFDDPPEAVARVLVAALPRMDADLKVAVVDRLLRRDRLPADAVAKLLAPTEPPAIRRLALDHALDRTLAIDDAVAAVLEKDPDPGLRLDAVRHLAARGSSSARARKALLAAVSADSDREVRSAAAVAFSHSLKPTPEVVAGLLDALATARSDDLAGLVLGLLAPHVGRDAGVRAAVVAFAKKNVKTGLAVGAYRLLGRLAAWDRPLLDDLRAAYDAETDDRVRAALLRALQAWPDSDPRFVELCRDALKAPDKELKTWGARGLLHLPLTEGNVPAYAAAAEALADRDVDPDVRLDLARKIARIPDPPPAMVAALKRVAEHGDGELARIAEQASDRKAAESPGGADWATWLRRVDVEGRSEGIFPEIYARFDENPAGAVQVLKAALKPEVDLYQNYGYDVSPLQICQFLAAKGAVDDDVARYAINFVLSKDSSHGSPDAHLSLLFSRPNFPGLSDSLFTVLERRKEADPVLLRELLIAALGSESAASAAILKHFKAQETPGAARPYFRFLIGNLGWEPGPKLLEAAAKRWPVIEDAELERELREAFKDLGMERPGAPPPAPGPGFADE